MTQVELWWLGDPEDPASYVAISAANPLPVNASVTASIAPFAPGTGAVATLAVTNSTGNVALPAGATIEVFNVGANTAYLALGNAGVTATTGGIPLASGSWIGLAPGTDSYLAAITGSSTTSLTIIGGSGLPAGAVAGAGGGIATTVTLAAGTANIGTVVATGTVGVTGTVNIGNTVTTSPTGTQAVSGTVEIGAGAQTIGVVNQGTSPWAVGGTVEIGAGSANIGTVDIAGSQSITIIPSGTQTIAGTVDIASGQSVTIVPSGTQTVTGTVATSGTNTIAGTVTLAAGAAVIGTVDINSGQVVGLAAGSAVIGTVDIASGQTVTIVPSGTQTIAGTATVNGTVEIGTGAATIGAVAQASPPWTIQGDAGSGTAVAGNPVLVGGRAQNAENTAVSNGNAVDWALDLVGRGIVFPFANKENLIGGSASETGTAAGTIIAAQGSGVKIYITSLVVSNTGSVGTAVNLNDSSSAQLPAPANSGCIFCPPTPLVVAANTALTFTAIAGSSTITVTGNGFKGS